MSRPNADRKPLFTVEGQAFLEIISYSAIKLEFTPVSTSSKVLILNFDFALHSRNVGSALNSLYDLGHKCFLLKNLSSF